MDQRDEYQTILAVSKDDYEKLSTGKNLLVELKQLPDGSLSLVFSDVEMNYIFIDKQSQMLKRLPHQAPAPLSELCKSRDIVRQ